VAPRDEKGNDTMTTRRLAVLALLSGLVLGTAACGGSTATNAPAATPGTVASQQPAATQPGSSQGLPDISFGLPSFTPDTELEAMFPRDIAGETMTVTSMTGTEFLGGGVAGAQIAPVLSKLGKSPNDLSVAYGGTSSLVVGAFRLKGLPAAQFFSAYIQQVQTQQATITDASFAGKSVKKLAVPGSGTASYIYLHGDVVWTVGGIGGAEPSTDVLNEAFSKLP
jgi:hypothetical protein